MTEPRRLGRYELLEQLGEGGMGAVWLARLTGGHGFEKLCIVKTVLPTIAKDPEFVSRFLHEGRVLTQLHHANIAQVYDMGEEDETLFLALEYVPGVDLSTLHQRVRLKEEQLPLSLALYIAQQMAEGLGYAHRRAALDGKPLQIVHRDVSPQNVMVSYDGEVKVIDFGIARSEARSRHTAEASVMGKLGYMAPEQARGEPVDHRADQFAVGVVLWELLANAPYVPRGTLTEMVVAMANPPVRPLTPLRPDVPPSLEATVLKALSADPARRFPTTDDLARALMDELLRLAALPSKLQVGEYVRAHCEESYSSQQKLLTKASSLRTKPTAEVAVKTERATPAGAIDATVVRTSGEHPLPPPVATAQLTPAQLPSPAPGPSEPPMTTGELQKAALKKGRGPLFGAVIAVVAIAAIGGVAFALRGGIGGGASTAGADTATEDAGAANSGTANTGTANTGTANTGTANTGTANTEDAGSEATGTANTEDAGSEATGTATAGAPDAGDAVAIADGPQPGTGGEAPPPPGQGGLHAPPPPGVGGSDAPPPPGQGGLDAPPPPGSDGQGTPPGTAQLTARVRATGASYIISNASKVRWSSCTVVAPGQRVASLKPLGVGASQELPLRLFRTDASAEALSHALLIRCAQGEARVSVR